MDQVQSGGRVLGRYRLLEPIGRGGSGGVYRARDERLGRDVAVKVVEGTADDLQHARRHEDELRMLSTLSHHRVVTLLDAAVDRSDPARLRAFLVMELVAGSDLKQRLRRGPMSPRQVAQVGADIAEGLEYLHSRGVVHRDIKPANILLADYSDDGQPRAILTDFGIALDYRTRDCTGGGATTGTAAYLSPEQAQGEPLGPASDVYSLGLVLLECFTGTVAFPGDPVQSAVARLFADPVIPERVPAEWRQLLAAMTARDPADRPVRRDLMLALQQRLLAETARHKDADAVEEARLAAVHHYRILDTPPDGAFDRITAVAARVFQVPVSIVSIVDHDRIWFKSHHGLDIEQIDRAPGLCASAILQDAPWVVENARVDPRTLTNPLVASDFGLQFYTGIPLRTHDGYNLGTLCVLDFEPRTPSPDQIATLEDLAAVVMNDLELRLQSRMLAEAGAEAVAH